MRPVFRQAVSACIGGGKPARLGLWINPARKESNMQKRHEIDLSRACQPIQGASFTFRTLHAPDARWGAGRSAQRQSPIDRMITVTLPAIEGEKHKPIAHMTIIL